MSELSKKDVEILNLKAARMSTASIAMMVGWSEAKVYNRLNFLQVFSSGDALDRLEGRSAFSLSGLAAFGDIAFGLFVKSTAEAIERAMAAVPTPPAPAVTLAEALVVEPRRAPPRSAPRRIDPPKPVSPKPARPTAVATPLPVAASVPPPPVARRSPPGALRLKPVSSRVAAWAGHFRRARWPLAEVAHLFDVAEDDLAMALGEAA